jgi:hypothetical protein
MQAKQALLGAEKENDMALVFLQWSWHAAELSPVARHS